MWRVLGATSVAYYYHIPRFNGHHLSCMILPKSTFHLKRRSETEEICLHMTMKVFLRFVLKAFKLHDVAACESIEICFTLDGDQAVDPKDGSPLSSSVDGVFGRMFEVQSRNYCFEINTLLGKGCKMAYREFTDFLFFECLKRYVSPASQYG